MKRLLGFLLLVALLVAGYGALYTVRAPDELYAFTGRIAGCPSRASCVSSLDSNDLNRVAALVYAGDPQFARARLREILQRMDGRIEHETPEYLHAVFVTPTLKLHDDLELLIRADGQIEVRSALRFGYQDRGRNRARVEALRRAFEASP